MIYSDWVNAIGSIFKLQISSATAANPFVDAFVNLVLPRAIEYGELRIYRDPDLDLLAQRSSATATCVAAQRTITKPASIIVVEEMNLITPAGSAPDQNGSSRTQLSRATLSFINSQYPAGGTSSNGPPVYASQINDTTFVTGPTPDANYQVEFYGVTHPAPLSSTNTSTILTATWPDLFLAATCIFMAGYQKNFGSQADDPKMALSWEMIYDGQKRVAAGEEMRKKYRPTTTANGAPATGTSAAN